MPSEPDKKMDELLRTYARKRREDAGEPLEMHPATRRLLQAEAAKLRPREVAPQRTWWSWLFLRWPRVAFAVGVFALLAVAVWNAIPNRGQSSSPALLAKRDQQEKATAQATPLSRDGVAVPAAAAPQAQLDDRSELDKDLAKRPQPGAKLANERSLDEFRAGESLLAADAQADVKLKKESVGRGLRLQQSSADDLKLAEAEAVAGPVENQVLVRRLDAGAAATQPAAGQAASRLEPPAPGALSSGANLALIPGADAKAKQLGITYSAPGAPTAADAYALPPLVKQASPATNPVQFFNSTGGQGLGAERQPTTLSRLPAPTAPSTGTPAILAFDVRNNELKVGGADSEVEKRTDTGIVSLADRSQPRARAVSAPAGGVPVAAEATQLSALPRQYYRFKRQAEPEKPAEAKAAKDLAPVSVLSTFEFVQDGDHVRVIDSDGSVYAGQFVTGVDSGWARFAEVGEEPKRPALAGAEARRQSNTVNAARRYSTVAGTGSMTTNRVFRVNGTNRTYGQLVTIEALLSGGPASSASGGWRGVGPAGATAPPSARPTPESYSKSLATKSANVPIVAGEPQEAQRLVGKLRIGTSDEVKLIAVPVAK